MITKAEALDRALAALETAEDEAGSRIANTYALIGSGWAALARSLPDGAPR